MTRGDDEQSFDYEGEIAFGPSSVTQTYRLTRHPEVSRITGEFWSAGEKGQLVIERSDGTFTVEQFDP